MAKLTTKARFAPVDLPIDHNAQTNTVVHIYKQNILLLPHQPIVKFSIGHGPRIVFQESADAGDLFNRSAEWLFMKMKEAVTVTILAVDAA